LIRVLGVELYGKVIFAQVVSNYFGILIDFGFSNSATKEIACNRDDRLKLSEIVSAVLVIKFFMWCLSLVILIELVCSIEILNNEKQLFLFSFGLCFYEFLFPQWYFQGIEKMKHIAVVNVISRVVFVILILMLIHDRNDYVLVPIFNGIGALIGGLLGLYLVFIKDKIIFRFPTLDTLHYYFKDSMPLFGANIIISVKDRFNIIFLGSFLGMREVAIYDLSIQIMKLFMTPIDIINSTIFPKVAKEKNMQLMLKTTRLTFIVICALILLFQPFIPIVVNFLGKDLHEAVTLTRLLLISPLMMVWSLGFSKNCINALGHYNLLLRGMFFTTLFYLGMMAFGYCFNYLNSIYYYIIVVITVYLFELVYRIVIIKKYNLLLQNASQ
jgi:PST family polysaccharide transporter